MVPLGTSGGDQDRRMAVALTTWAVKLVGGVVGAEGVKSEEINELDIV